MWEEGLSRRFWLKEYMERLKKLVADTVFAMQILIVFVLVFENRIALPLALQAFGRLHPLLLHLPISLLLLTVVLLFSRRHFEGKGMDELIGLLLHFTALTASATTLMGLFLSLEGTFGVDQLWLHKWLGIALSFICWSLLVVKKLPVQRTVGLAGVALLILTGHYGATLTHGENFVLGPLQVQPPKVARVITDSTAVFSATIEPIFEAKCYGCHNSRKAKGNLILTSLEHIQKGGKDGPLWKPSDAAHSLLVEKLLLPLDHDEHMPPRDKVQLTDDEIAFIRLWIDRGADTAKTLRELDASDTLHRLASMIIPRYQQVGAMPRQYAFDFAPIDKIEALDIPNRTVFQIAHNEPAVAANFYLRDAYEKKYLDELAAVKEQLVSLNLSKMPVQDGDLRAIEGFPHLEVLNLNNTAVTGSGFTALTTLPALRSLSVAGTSVTVEALRKLGELPSLQEVFIWNTSVSADMVAALKSAFPNVKWEYGYVPDEAEILKLNAPMLRNKRTVLQTGEKVILNHNLPGTVIHYALDGAIPDSVVSPVYAEPIAVGHFGLIQAKAFKDGWISSDISEFFFFREGYRPDSIALNSAPDKRYEGEGVHTLFDGEKGLPAFYRHPAWMAFRENDLELSFSFEKKVPPIRHITLSFARNRNTICLPPEAMELWGGHHPDQLQLLASARFPEGEGPAKPRIEGVTMAVPASDFRYYKLVAKPMRKMADGNRKKRGLWLMVDEVFIN